MAKSKQYILLKKNKIISTAGASFEKGDLLAVDDFKKLSSRQQEFCEEFDASNPAHQAAAGLSSADASAPLDGDAYLSGSEESGSKAGASEEESKEEKTV